VVPSNSDPHHTCMAYDKCLCSWGLGNMRHVLPLANPCRAAVSFRDANIMSGEDESASDGRAVQTMSSTVDGSFGPMLGKRQCY